MPVSLVSTRCCTPGSSIPATNEQRRFSISTRRGRYKLTSMKIRIQSLAAITFILAMFALQPIAEAVVPPPDGGYPGANTAEGENALLSLTTGTFDTAVGFFALKSNDLGNYNTAIGAGALFANNESVFNTATGAGALLLNTGGADNTANGAFALLHNQFGSENTAIGTLALQENVDGSS